MQLQSLQDVLTHELQDLYDAEKQLVQALPKMAGAASSQELRTALEDHLGETKDHVRRLEDIFGQLGISKSAEACDAMRGLISEGEKTIATEGDPTAKDAALIAAAQRVEHYEIAGYGTARTLADELDLSEAQDLLEQTLDEEANADKLLTKIATGGMFKTGINKEAAR